MKSIDAFVYEKLPIRITGIPELREGTEYGVFAEFIEVYGSAQALADSAVNQVKFHRTFGVARVAAVETLVKVSGVAQLTKVVLDDQGNPTKNDDGSEATEIDEKDALYVARVFALQPDIKVPVTEVEFNAKSTPRGPAAEKGPGKNMLEASKSLIAKGPEAVKKTVKLLVKNNPGMVLELAEDGTIDEVKLAYAIKANHQRVAAEQNAALGLD